MANVHPEYTQELRERIERINRNRRIKAGDHEMVLLDARGRQSPVAYRPINLLGDFLTQSLVELTWSGYPTIVADGASKEQEGAISRLTTQLRIPVLAKATSSTASYAGHCGWRMIIDRRTGRPTLQLWGVREGQWITCESDDGDPAHAVAITLWHSRRISGNKYAAVAERFAHLVDGEGRIIPGVLHTTTAYGMAADGTVQESTIPLETIYADRAPEPEVVYTELTELPVTIVHNPDFDADGWGDSDYTPSRVSWQHEYNLTQARRSFSLRLKTTPTLTADPNAANADGSLDLDSLFLQYRTPDGNSRLEINSTAWDAALADSAVQIDKLRQDFYLITPLSPALSGDVAAAESAEARRLSLISAKASVNDRRMMIEPCLTWAYTVAMQLERMAGLESLEPVAALSYIWPAAIPEELEEQQITSQTTINEVSANLRSVDSAIARLNPTLTAQQLATERAKIDEAAAERADAVMTNFSLAPGA
jgi:hypothetical protein